jgi:hypothetical protein
LQGALFAVAGAYDPNKAAIMTQSSQRRAAWNRPANCELHE